MTVCESCRKYGKVIGKPAAPPTTKKKPAMTRPPSERQIIQVIRPDLPAVLTKKRTELGLKQKDLAQKIAEKESLIHKMESGHFVPSLSLARKLEKFLHVRLVEQHEEEEQTIRQQKGTGLTIGDLLKMKKDVN